ncbi:MAG: ABC transporter permease [Myxococcales bacterium]|nr:ABC transporter permease [Myxococcales bacterium]
MNALGSIGAPALLLARALRAGLSRGLTFREWLAQLYEIGNRSVWLVSTGLAFFGAVMVAIGQHQARRFTGNLAVVGPAYFELLVREFGTMTSVLLAAASAGASISAELASMKVNEQLEALEMSAGDPLADLVAPRVLASAVAVPLLCVIGTVAAGLSAAVVATFAYGSDGLAFIDARFVDRWDLLNAFLKAFLCGLFIPVAASWRGLKAGPGAGAVGAAVTGSVVDACLGCLLIDFLVSFAFLLVGV